MIIDLLASREPGTALESVASSPRTSSWYQSLRATPQLEGATIAEPNQQRQQHQPRFLAGASFFNYDACGSLRPGKPAIQLFTHAYMGLAIHVALTGFTYEFFTYGFGRLLAEYLKADDERQVSAASFVLAWPQALSIVIGIISDAFPIAGYRRKSYMVLGWLLTLSMCVVIIILDLFGNSGDKLYASVTVKTTGTELDSRYAAVYLAVSLLTATGIQICWLSAVALSIEFAQREQIHVRGRLQGTLVALYYFGGFLARVVTVLILSQDAATDRVTSTVSLGQAAIFLAGVSVFAIPFAWQCVTEDRVPQKTEGIYESVTLHQRLAHFWKYCHHNIAYRTLFFICLHGFFSSICDRNAQDAVEVWSDISIKGSLTVDAGRMLVMTVSTLVWTRFLRNRSWRKTIFWSTAFVFLDYAVLTLATVYNVVRGQWFYTMLMYFGDAPWAWIIVFLLVLATEISEIGYEGVTVALGISFQTLAVTASYTLSGIFPDLFGFKVTMDQVRADDPTTRSKVASAFWIAFMTSLPALVMPLLTPQQKLDAQQMHAYGGYNQYASSALLLFFVVLLGFNLVASLVVMLY